MPVVTLISDLGNRDYHVAAAKGVLLNASQNIQLVDITHNIEPYNYLEAAYNLNSCFRDFPAETIHLVGVEGDFNKKNQWLIAYLEQHIFITKNNGVLSLISSQAPEWCYLIDIESKKDLKFPFKNIVAKTAAKLLLGKTPDQLGVPFLEPTEFLAIEPSLKSNSIMGQVIYTTPYKNAVTNISRKTFEAFAHFSKCRIFYNKTDTFTKIHNSYHDVAEGNAACFFGQNGLLEIGLNGGKATQLLSLNIGKKIWIEFE